MYKFYRGDRIRGNSRKKIERVEKNKNNGLLPISVSLFAIERDPEYLKKKNCPKNWGITAWYQSLGIRIPRACWT